MILIKRPKKEIIFSNKFVFHLYNYKKLYITNIIVGALFIYSYYLYNLSLEKCFFGEDGCGNKMPWIRKKVKQLSTSCIIISILFFCILINKISRFHLIHLLLIFAYFYQKSHSYYFYDHGLFNFIAFFLVLFIIVISLFILRAIILWLISYFMPYKVKNICILFLILLYYKEIDPWNCDDWGLGLNKTYIENDINRYGCQIEYPKYCTYHIFQYLQDLTKIANINCKKRNKDLKANIFKKSNSPYINANTKKFGFPITNKEIEGSLDGKDEFLRDFMFNNLFDVDNNTRNISYEPELILDFSGNDYGNYIIDLKFNKTLSRERKKLEKNISPYSENIFIIFVDSVSRGNSVRKFKKTLSIFEKFMPYEGGYYSKFPEEHFHSFQFFKYHSFKDHTNGNFPLIFFGRTREEKNLILLTKYFKENGYVTMYSSDNCQKDNTRTFHNYTDSEVYDHQLLICDPNKIYYTAPYIKCLYGKMEIEHLMNYTDQFWRKYNDNRKFVLVASNDGHEGTLEVVKYTDEVIYKYLINLFNENLLKDTSIIFLSDHGDAMPSLYSVYNFFSKEKRLPMLYLLINDRKNVSYEEQYLYLQKNQQTFITGYDIYNTINHLLYGDTYIDLKNKTKRTDRPKTSKGISLFNYINQKERTPKNYKNMAKWVCK